jgi:hypothetical protein
VRVKGIGKGRYEKQEGMGKRRRRREMERRHKSERRGSEEVKGWEIVIVWGVGRQKREKKKKKTQKTTHREQSPMNAPQRKHSIRKTGIYLTLLKRLKMSYGS